MSVTMLDNPLEDALDAALAMIDVRRWGLRVRIVSLVRRELRITPDDWVYVGYRDLAARLACSDRYLWDLLGDKGTLWRVDRVLERGRVGAGQRGTAYRLHPPDQWRNVPWLEDNRELRLLRLRSPSRAPHRAANDGLEARSHSAALTDLAPRSHSAALDPLAPRSHSAPLGIASGAPRDRGANLEEPGVSTNCLGEADASLSRSSRERAGEAAQQLQQAIEARTGAPCYGRLLARIDRLAATHDLAAMLAAVAAAPPGLLPPGIVERCERAAAGTLHPAAGGPPVVNQSLLRARAAQLERRLATYAAERADPPEQLLADLAECQTQIDVLEEG
jgi:hypothetical protein